MNNKILYIIGGIIITILVIFLIGNSKGNKKLSTVNTNPTLITTKPEDVVPGLYQNPIKNTSIEAGFTITSAIAENNLDESQKPTDDHLEIALKNNTSKDLTDFEVYYLITDTVTQKKEGYAVKLTGFTLKSGQIQTIHFDNKQMANHFEVNTNSLYYKSPNKMTFDVMVSAAGYKVETIQINKDAGGAELKD